VTDYKVCVQHHQSVTQKVDYLRDGYEVGTDMSLRPREQMKRAKKTYHTSTNQDQLFNMRGCLNGVTHRHVVKLQLSVDFAAQF